MNNLITAAYDTLLHSRHICKAVKDTGQVSGAPAAPAGSQCGELGELWCGRGRCCCWGREPGGHSRIAPDQRDASERRKVTAGPRCCGVIAAACPLVEFLSLVSPFPQMALNASCEGSVLVFTLLSYFLSCLLYLIVSTYLFSPYFQGNMIFFPF